LKLPAKIRQRRAIYSRNIFGRQGPSCGSIVSHPFDFAQGRLLQNTQGLGAPLAGMMLAENQG
jgi:hypothetical protein